MKRSPSQFFIGTAGWSIPKSCRSEFLDHGTHLERYSDVFPAVEINSSFYRPHRIQTYARWAQCVPSSFRFSVKIPKAITHELRLKKTKTRLVQFCAEIAGLEEKLGCVLVQLPPSLEYDASLVRGFFELLRTRCHCDIACEPRHISWFSNIAIESLSSMKICMVNADPPVSKLKIPKVKSSQARYYRLHGSPRMYYSNYSKAALKRLCAELKSQHHTSRIWCFFDNTASNAATPNALWTLKALRAKGRKI